MSLESEVLAKIKPSPAQNRKVREVVAELFKKVSTEARSLGIHIDSMLVGSVAKGTHLRDPDVDLFMLFPESTPLETMKEKGLEIGRRVIDGREHFAQHPYVRGTYKGFQVDLVPCFKIRDTKSKMSAVDRTPFHTEFVKKHLGASQADEVRLLKRFMKGVGCYGAEAKVQGFSGYLCELLVMRFGTFRKVLEAAKEWKVGEALELPGFPGKEFPETFTFVDPVDPTRNVASAVAPETLVRLVMACRDYLQSPSEKLFFPLEQEIWSADKIESVAGPRIENLVSVSFPKIDLIDDVVYPQLRKSLAGIIAYLQRADFEVEKTSIHVDGRTHLMVELSSMALPKQKKHRGPPVNSENAGDFLAKWNSIGESAPYVEDGRWYVMITRSYDRADDYLLAKIRTIPLGKDVKKIGEYEILSGKALLSKEHLDALTHHFDERLPWQR
ncbi:MAG TPA: CCA tRNA nucleotidyltransferase [Thermoplasmata archaeon]|nr:CCA tRNA nucleotidyltransferase [Thermoplasmata archaeon]